MMIEIFTTTKIPGFGFGLLLSLDSFVGVTMLWGWWMINLGVRFL